MTNLRVFQTPEDRVLIEVSSQHLQLSRGLFVAASFAKGKFAQLNSAETLQVLFHGEAIEVFYMDVSSLSRSTVYSQCRLIGALQETDSINILNHIVDILAYP